MPSTPNVTYTASEFSAPSASFTSATGINDQGHIVGSYRDNYGIPSGYLDNGGSFTPIHPPGSNAPTVAAINARDVLVGRDFAGGAFLYQDGTYSPLNVPGATFTAPTSINDFGTVAGFYSDGTHVHGFLDRNGAYSTINHPNAADTTLAGVNNLGQIAGTYDNGDPNHQTGFLDVNGRFTDIAFPGASSTEVIGINNLGVILGQYSSGATTGYFLEIAGRYAAVTGLPGPANGLNDLGRIAGTDFSTSKAYVATPQIG